MIADFIMKHTNFCSHEHNDVTI